LVYTYEILYQITKHKIYLEYARRHCEILKKTIDNDMYYDLVYGNAGAILALLNLYDLTGEEEYLRIADLAGEKLFASQQFEENTRKGWLGAGSKYPLAGFSHGVAGIAYSLVKLWSYTQKEKYLQAVVASIRFENSLYDDKIGNWKDEREYNGHKSSEQNIYMTAWCHGAAGILLSRCKIMQFDIDKELQDELNKDIKTALATTLKYGFGENDCLCHGNLGNTEILMEYGRMFNDIKTLDLCGEIREAACKRILGANYDSGRSYLYGYQIPGFMTGLSGMGYSLLRDINKELPCILSLEI
jgi:lantibiotic modifying enzyme